MTSSAQTKSSGAPTLLFTKSKRLSQRYQSAPHYSTSEPEPLTSPPSHDHSPKSTGLHCERLDSMYPQHFSNIFETATTQSSWGMRFGYLSATQAWTSSPARRCSIIFATQTRSV